jgi:hypothetical protein
VKQPPRYRLDLVALPDPEGVPPANRLRRLLKALLRGWGFRCIRAVEVRPVVPDDATPAKE